MDKIGIGKRIKHQREQLHLQQDEFGRAFNCSSTCVYSWESGRTTPDAITLYEISRFCGKEISYFLDDDIDINETPLDSTTNINCVITSKDLQLLNKIRTLTPEMRQAIETILSIKNN